MIFWGQSTGMSVSIWGGGLWKFPGGIFFNMLFFLLFLVFFF